MEHQRLCLTDLPADILFSICYNLERTQLAYTARVNIALRDVCQYLLEHKRKIRLVDDNLAVIFSGLGPLSGVTSCMKNLYRMCLNPPEEPSYLLPKYPAKLIIETETLSRREYKQTVTLFEGRREYLRRAFLADICVLVLGAYDTHEINVDVNKIVGICHMMSSRDLIVAINLDSTSKSAEKVFYEKRNYISEILNKAVGPCFDIIPVDAMRGTNLTKNGAQFEWFKGENLFALLRGSQNRSNFDEKMVENLRSANLQIAVYDNFRKDHHAVWIYLGKILSGTLRLNDKLMFITHHLSSTVTSIRIRNNQDAQVAVAGDTVGFQLKPVAGDYWYSNRKINKNIDTAIHDKYSTLGYTVAFRAKFVVLDSAPLRVLRTYKLYYGGMRVLARLIYIFPQKKYQDPRDGKKLKVFSGILWPFSRVAVQPFKPSEFQKNHVGKVLIAENHCPIAIGRVDKVCNKKVERTKIRPLRYYAFDDEIDALIENARKYLFDASEQHLVPIFLEMVKKYRRSLVWV